MAKQADKHKRQGSAQDAAGDETNLAEHADRRRQNYRCGNYKIT